MSTLERAIAISAQAHAGQKDKAKEPYILHPLRVMLRFESEEDRIVAILHDVLEDTSVTDDDLRREGFSGAVVDAVIGLTRRKKDESYEAFIQRAAANPISLRVKLADLEDNMNLSRLPTVTERDLERMEKYRRAHTALLARRSTG